MPFAPGSIGVGVGGGSAAFGGVAPIHAPDADQSLAVYLFSPIVEDHEVLDWELRATERAAAVVGVADTPATRDIYANSAETAGLRISLLDPSGAAGNAWTFGRGANAGALRFESVEDTQTVRLAGEIFNGVTTFGQILAAANAAAFVSAAYFGGTVDATTVNGNILIPGGGGNFHGGVDGTPAVPEEAIGATVDAENEAILLRIRVTDTAGDIKAVVDAVEGLGSDYRGGIGAGAVASRALPWTEDFTLVTVIGGPEGPRGLQGMLTPAARQEVEDARDAAQTAAQAAAASAVDADGSETDAETAQAGAVAAETGSGVARDGAVAAQTLAQTARTLAVDARDEAGAARNDAQSSQIQAGQSASAAGASASAAAAAQTAAEAARDAAQAQTGFTAALTNAVTGNTETGIDATVDADGKLNLVVTGGGTPPVVAHARYVALTLAVPVDAAGSGLSSTTTTAPSSDTEDVTIPVFAENRYLTFTRQADLAAPDLHRHQERPEPDRRLHPAYGGAQCHSRRRGTGALGACRQQRRSRGGLSNSLRHDMDDQVDV